MVVSVTRAMLVSSRYMLLLTKFRTLAVYHKSAILSNNARDEHVFNIQENRYGNHWVGGHYVHM